MSEREVTQARSSASSKRAGTRDRIVQAAAELLAEGGREAVSTRAVAAAAGVQAPTIYRLFGDMRGLLDEVAGFGFSRYLGEKTAREVVEDPVEDLRRGWDLHVGFGLANPAFYALMYGDPGTKPTAALAAEEILRELVQRIAEAGRLRVGVERAVGMIHAAGSGVVLALIGTESDQRDPALSGAAREAILAAVITDGSDGEATRGDGRDRAANRAVALKTILPEAEADLTPGERALLSELLDRIADPAR
ncbi:MAG TPA: TetR/AcrR family transcriptional regulator [Thermomicrobiales bacterium]|nr:TetR/AcrR family transcriptional regulator [Thermomicrobiales bacterium]